MAVKLCPAVGDPAGRDRFLAECRTLAGLHQTSIVPVLSAGRQGLWLYSVMPLIEGASLAELVRRARAAGPGPLPPLSALVAGPDPPADRPADRRPVRTGPDYLRSAAEVLAQAADAVAYAHQQGVWHLDLKPANLMLEETGHCWVIDFGPSRDAGTALPAGGADPPFLTTAYAAPEQWAGGGDARSDVWGLGATLYELITLRRPFGNAPAPGRTVAEGVHPVPPRTLAPDVPRDLQAVCLKALARRPEDRYPTAAAFAADLRRWLDGEELAARPWPPLVRLWDLARRHRAWAAAVVTSLVGMTATLFFLWQWEQTRGRQAAAEGEAALARAELRREAEAATRSRAWALVEQARDRLAQSTAGRRADVRRLLLAAAREQRSIGAADDRSFGLALRSLYAGSLERPDARLPPPGDLLRPPGRSAFADWPADIHPDGHQLAIGTARQPVVWRKEGPKPVLVAEDANGPRSRVAYSPDGAVLAELRPPSIGGGLRVWTADASRRLGELIPRGEPGEAVLAVGFDPAGTRVWAARSVGPVLSWHLPSLARAAEWPVAAPARATAAAFAPRDGLVAFGDAHGGVVGHDPTGTAVVRFTVPNRQGVEALAWSPDARRLAVGSSDGVVHVVRRDGLPEYRVAVSGFGVAHVGFSPDGRWLTAHFRGCRLRVWDAHTGRLALTGDLPAWGFTRDGRGFAAASTGEIGFGELLPPDAVDRYEGHPSAVHQLAWAPDGGRLVTLSGDFEVRVWDTARPGVPAAVLAAPPATGGFWAEQSAVALGPGGRQAAYASGGEDGSRVVVWDVVTRQELPGWDLPGGYEKLAPAGPGRFLSVREEIRPGTRNVTGVVRLLEVGKPAPPGRVIRSPGSGDRSRFIDHWLLPGGRYYLWAGPREPVAGRRVELYETDTGRRVWQLVPPTEPNDAAPGCLLTEDLRTLWVADGTPRLLRFAPPPQGPPAPVPVDVYAASADGRWVLAGVIAADGMPRAAVLRRGDRPWVEFPLRDLLAPTGGRYLFSPDGRHLAWGSQSGSVTVIDLPTLEDRLNRFEAELAAPG